MGWASRDFGHLPILITVRRITHLNLCNIEPLLVQSWWRHKNLHNSIVLLGWREWMMEFSVPKTVDDILIYWPRSPTCILIWFASLLPIGKPNWSSSCDDKAHLGRRNWNVFETYLRISSIWIWLRRKYKSMNKGLDCVSVCVQMLVLLLAETSHPCQQPTHINQIHTMKELSKYATGREREG